MQEGYSSFTQFYILSISNFWLSAFRLPQACIREIEKLFSVFLWSGPELIPKKAKMAWADICKPKYEGGLGIISLKEINNVSCLKLIWRLASFQESFWVRWIHQYLIRKATLWSIKDSSSVGSWMWRKFFKCRTLAKTFHKVDVQNGKTTSFWFNQWSELGYLNELLGPRGVVNLGIPLSASVADAWNARRRRHHRSDILKQVEDVLDTPTKISTKRSRYSPLEV